MIKKITCLLVCLIVQLSSTFSFARDQQVIVAIDESYPPYMYAKDKKIKGLYPTLIEAIFSRIVMPVEIQALPWKRALYKGSIGEAAIGGIYRNERRLSIYDFSRPIFEEKLSIYVKKGNVFPFQRISDLKGKKVGLNFGWSYGESLDKGRKNGEFAVEESKDNQTSFKKLTRGRVDCIIVDELAASRIIYQQHLHDQVEKLTIAASVNKTYVAFPHSFNHTELVDRFNQALQAMKADGSYQQLVDDFIKQNLAK